MSLVQTIAYFIICVAAAVIGFVMHYGFVIVEAWWRRKTGI